MAIARTYRTYRFIDKDPVIDEVRTIVQDEGLMKRLGMAANLAGLSKVTLDNWFNGHTKRPQNASIMALVSSLGYERKFTRTQRLDFEEELKKAIAWKKKQDAARPKKKNGKA
jgi:hypothetical protein